MHCRQMELIIRWSYSDVFKRRYEIPIISVRSHEDNRSKMYGKTKIKKY